jgi:hypothetical protein
MSGSEELSSDQRRLFEELESRFAHVWMVRTFIRHSDEAEEDDDLQRVQRTLYDVMHALGGHSDVGDAAGYIRQARKKLRRLREATSLLSEIQPQISTHTNYRMAVRSLRFAAAEIERLLADDAPPVGIVPRRDPTSTMTTTLDQSDADGDGDRDESTSQGDPGSAST